MNKKQMVTITKQESESLLANGESLKWAFRGLVRPHDDFTRDIVRNRRKTFARQRKLDRGKMWNLLAQPIGEWGPIALDFLDSYGTAEPRYYQKWGFPHYVLTDAEKSKELRSLLEYDHSGLIADGVVGQTMHALGTAWSYFPHAWGVRSGDKRTPIEVFKDDLLLRKAIVKMIRHTSNSRLTQSVLRKGLRSFSGTQGVSNFRPTAAAAIYHKYLPENGVTWDMSMGWGGRLLGAVACHKVKKYIGCDPATETFAGLTRMDADIKRLLPDRGLETSLHMLGSETAEMRAALPEGGVDLCFTSPPYWEDDGVIENYSDEPTQSHTKFPTREGWLNGFMGTTIDNCKTALKTGGILALNVSERLGDDIKRLAAERGFVLVETLQLSLSKMMGTRHTTKASHKYEPVYVFRKG